MIRIAGSEDTDVLIRLIEDFYLVDGHDFDEAFVRQGLEPLLDSDRYGFALVADEDGAPGGYIVITWGYSLESGGRDALVDEFYVARRGKGLGSRLLEAALERIAAAGVTRVFLETEKENERVRGLYSRYGFVADDSVWMSADLEPAR